MTGLNYWNLLYCVNPVASTGRTSVNIGVSANLELVDKDVSLIEREIVQQLCAK